jgi:hypothetical protein
MSGGYLKQYTNFLAVCSPLDTWLSTIALVTSGDNPQTSRPQNVSLLRMTSELLPLVGGSNRARGDEGAQETILGSSVSPLTITIPSDKQLWYCRAQSPLCSVEIRLA